MRASSSQPPIPYWPSIICLLTALIITTSQAVARNQKENMRIACSDQATKQKVIDSLQTVLSRLSTPDDSVTELFNIYDLAVAPEKSNTARNWLPRPVAQVAREWPST